MKIADSAHSPRTRALLVAAAWSTVITADPALGQLGVRPGVGAALHLELARPDFDEPGLFPGLRGAWTADATAVVPAGDRVSAFARVGLSRASVEGVPSSTTLSHPRVGIVVEGASWLLVEVHTDLPWMQELGERRYATTVGSVADYERLERYRQDAWSLGGSLTPWTELSGGLVVSGRLAWTITSSTPTLDREIFLAYAGSLRFPVGATEWDASISAIALLSEEGLSFNERTIHFASLSVAAVEAPARPELFIRAPVDTNLDPVLNWVLGVRVYLGG